MKFKELLSELKKLDLPRKEFAIFGSGPLAVRGIRDSNDLDIIVRSSLWKKLEKKYKVENNKIIHIGSIEIYKEWTPWFSNIESLIDTAEIIGGFPFVRLEYVVEWKRKFNREKDRRDIELIKNDKKRKIRL